VVQWVARMSRNWLVAGSKTIKVVSFSKKHYPHCSLVFSIGYSSVISQSNWTILRD